MVRTTNEPAKAADRAQLRRELLRLIVKNEAQRRDQPKAQVK
jgi:hypothetical protein